MSLKSKKRLNEMEVVYYAGICKSVQRQRRAKDDKGRTYSGN
jgi:hypothetical protein